MSARGTSFTTAKVQYGLKIGSPTEVGLCGPFKKLEMMIVTDSLSTPIFNGSYQHVLRTYTEVCTYLKHYQYHVGITAKAH